MSDEKFFHVGGLGDSPPAPTEFEPSPFKKAKVPDPLHFEVCVVAHAEERQMSQREEGVDSVNLAPGRGER